MLDLHSGARRESPAAFIKDTDELRFEQDVMASSMTQPVIVHFWSPRSALCRQMMPMLEKAVTEAGGTVLLAKVEIDRNPALAQALRIQTVPTVYVFSQGRPVDGFAGARPEADIRALVEGLKARAAPVPGGGEETVKKILAEGDEFFCQGSLEEAMSRFATALELDPSSMEALAGLGWCLLTQGDITSVRDMLAELSPEQLAAPRIKGLQFILSLGGQFAGADSLASLEQKAQKNPKDLQAQYDLALQYFAGGMLEKGVEALIILTRRDREWQEQKARKLLLEIFEALGNTHPLTLPARRKLSSVLFS